MLHESDGMRTRRRRESGDPHAERLPDTAARLVTFTILTETRSGRRKTTQVRILTTLLDYEQYPAREIAALYSERWQIEIAFLHLKKTVRGARRALRGQSPDLARQEAWALLLIHNITATATARAAATAGIDPGLIPFTAVLGLVRAHVTPTPPAGTADTALPAQRPARRPGQRHHRPARHRSGRQRTSGRTASERRTRHTEEVTYTIDITKSNIPKGTQLRKLKGSALMREGRVSGIANQHHPTTAPPRQTRQLDKSPETHVPLNVTHQVENTPIPRVCLKDAESLVSCSRYAI